MLFLVFAIANTVVYAQSKKQQIIILKNRVDSIRLALSNETQVKLKNEKRDALKISDLERKNKELKTVNNYLIQKNSVLQEKYDGLLLKLEMAQEESTELKTDLEKLKEKNLEFKNINKDLEEEKQIDKKQFTSITNVLSHWWDSWDKTNSVYEISLNDPRIADEVLYIGALVEGEDYVEYIFVIDEEQIKFTSKQIEKNGSIVELKFVSHDFTVVMEYDEENVTGDYTEGMIRLVFGGVEQVKTSYVMSRWW